MVRLVPELFGRIDHGHDVIRDFRESPTDHAKHVVCKPLAAVAAPRLRAIARVGGLPLLDPRWLVLGAVATIDTLATLRHSAETLRSCSGRGIRQVVGLRVWYTVCGGIIGTCDRLCR